jgi:hypothetical protein
MSTIGWATLYGMISTWWRMEISLPKASVRNVVLLAKVARFSARSVADHFDHLLP